MSNYVVTDSELTSIANAIRTKGGTQSNLSFPSGFVSAINNLGGDDVVEFVNFEIDSESITYAEKTPAQVRAMIDNGKLPIAKIMKNSDRPLFGYIHPTGMTSSGYTVNFQSLMFADNADYVWGVIIRETSRSSDVWRLDIVEKSFS